MKSVCCAILVFGLTATVSADEMKQATTARQELEPVTVDNFVRAATDIELSKYVALAEGVNRFYHFRSPTPVEKQPTIRMNRDTLYSMAVIDISEGAKVTLPDAGDRYLSMMIIDQDHYIPEIFHGGGTYTLDPEVLGISYVLAIVRTLVETRRPWGYCRRERYPAPDDHRRRVC